MKRLLPFALMVTLLTAPAVFAQGGKTSPPPATASQPKPKDTPKPAEKPAAAAPPADMSKEMEDAAKPGSNHKLLEWFEGDWAAVVRTTGQEKTDAGTMTCKMVYGGRFLTMDFDGRSRGKFFRGGGMWGYNNLEKRFEQTWADSESTQIMFMYGKASADGKTFTLVGEMPDPMTGKRTAMKAVTTITGKDTWKYEFYSVEGGKEMKQREITYTKVKAEKPADKPDDKPMSK